jgi:hypothetical protein
MNFKINSTEFYSRQNQEIKRFLNVEKKTLHICINQDNLFLDKEKLDVLALKNQKDIIQSIFKLEKKYDLIIITDLFEVSSDIYELLKTTRDKLNNNGKILISTINPKWRRILNFSEFINIKKQIRKSSNTKLKKIVSSARSSGLELNYFYTKQIFPFKLLGFGRVLNKVLELIFFKFNLGIKSYILFSNITFLKTEMSKSVIVPAKNESKNLEILFESFPKLSSLNEIILICAESKDNTLEMGKDISKKKSDLKIKVIEQESTGKAGAVFEALEHTTGELIAILDSDISVDFVNGTRLIYPIENKSMRFLNRLGNKFFKFAVSSVIRNPLSDSLCGTKVFRRSHINRIISWRKDLNSLDPFGDFDFLFSAAYYGEKISEYPVHYKARIYGKTQINRFRDGFKLIYYFFKSFSKFNSSIN